MFVFFFLLFSFFFQAEDGIRDLVRSRGLGDVYKRQVCRGPLMQSFQRFVSHTRQLKVLLLCQVLIHLNFCLLYTSDAADERSSVDLGGRRIINKKTNVTSVRDNIHYDNLPKTAHSRKERPERDER